MLHRFGKALVALGGITAAFCSAAQDRLPIIDMHLHAVPVGSQGPPPVAICTPMTMPVWDQRRAYGDTFMGLLKNPACDDPVWSPKTDNDLRSETLEALELLNIIGVTSGPADYVARWRAAAPERIIPGLMLNVARHVDITPALVRTMVNDGRLKVLGEVTNQYSGVTPDDERMAPYWQLAEELDIPVGIHVGTGPPGVIYLGSGNYRAHMHSAMTLEEVLVRHPKLRVYLMHAGFPLLDDLLTVMYAHPQVYAGVGVIVYTQKRNIFYRYMQGIFDAGFGKRVLFGTDQMVWPGVIERSVEVIQQAPFLTEEQKRDVLYNNAARFLRLSEDEIKRHHAM